MELLSLIKRKSSCDSNSNSPEFKRRREEQELEDLHEVLDILTIPEDTEAEQSDMIVLTALLMAQNFASKAYEILANLTQLDAITLQITLLQNSVDKTECYRKCLGKWGCTDQERVKNCYQRDEWTEEQWK